MGMGHMARRTMRRTEDRAEDPTHTFDLEHLS